MSRGLDWLTESPSRYGRARVLVQMLVREGEHTRKDIAAELSSSLGVTMSDGDVGVLMGRLPDRELMATRRDGKRTVWFYPSSSEEFHQYLRTEYNKIAGNVVARARQIHAIDTVYGLEGLEDQAELGRELTEVLRGLPEDNEHSVESDEFFDDGRVEDAGVSRRLDEVEERLYADGWDLL